MSRTQLFIWRQAAVGIFLLCSFALTVTAQNVLPPDDDTSELVFEEMPSSRPQAPSVASVPVKAPAVASPKDSDAVEAWDDTRLRDPFWPVGYFPEDWQKAPVEGDAAMLDSLGWKAAAAKIRISGTSLMNEKTAAVVNGSLKTEGDLIEVKHGGRLYQWLIDSIDANGQIHLKKQSVR